MTEKTVWAAFTPRGRFIVARDLKNETIQDAIWIEGAHPVRWNSLEQEGYTVRKVRMVWDD